MLRCSDKQANNIVKLMYRRSKPAVEEKEGPIDNA